jgi:hypothetical protein
MSIGGVRAPTHGGGARASLARHSDARGRGTSGMRRHGVALILVITPGEGANTCCWSGCRGAARRNRQQHQRQLLGNSSILLGIDAYLNIEG